MLRLLSVLYVIACCMPLPTAAVYHPTLNNPIIERCRPDNGYPCGQADYTADGVVLTDLTPAAPPQQGAGLALQAHAIHCEWGDAASGVPFTECSWAPMTGHRPAVRDCWLIDDRHWDLTPTSTCSATTIRWGHSGAGAGGECVVFVQNGLPPKGTAAAATVFGLLDPTTLANSGNQFCQKPLPPSAPCDIMLPATIDHGTVGENETSAVSIDGTVSCGISPVITILGGGLLTLAPGVTAALTTTLRGGDAVTLTSTLTTASGTVGEHRASVVVIASPY